MSFRVSTVHLSPEATRADPTQGTIELGELSDDALVALLERLRVLDAAAVVDAEPEVVITSRAGRFIVRAGRQKLFLYEARAHAQPYAELTATEIVTQLERMPVAPLPTADGELSAPVPSAHRAAPHRGIAATILIAGLALNGYTLYSVFYTESVNEAPVVTLLTEPADIATRTQMVVGTYATGEKTGDRTIIIQGDGQVRFTQLGSSNVVLNNRDTYHIGRKGERFALATAESGVIEVFDPDTLIYYRDIYKRK